MKKILFYGGLLALATSCADQEFDSLRGDEGKAKGITFTISEADTRIQYDKDGESYNPFWYAEQDRIAIWAIGTKKGLAPAIWRNATYGYWDDLATINSVATGDSVIYKATQSKSKANFTAISDDDLLSFIDDTKAARFFAVYPADAVDGIDRTLANAPAAGTPGVIQNGAIQLTGLLTDLQTQNVTSTKGANAKITMIAKAEAQKQNDYDAVGEKVALEFQYVAPVIRYATKGMTKEYQTAFGKLEQITLKTKGYNSTTPALTIPASRLNYGAQGATLKVDTLTWNTALENLATSNTPDTTAITVNIAEGAGLDWDDNAIAPVVVAENPRKTFADNNVKETLKSMLVFTNIDLADEREIPAFAAKKNTFLGVTIQLEKYPWLVTKGSSGNSGRVLFVNSGALKDIFADAAGNITWTDTYATSGTVAPSTIAKVYIREGVTVTDADFAMLQKMTNVTELTIEGVTSIPADGLKLLTNLTKVVLPKVTTVGNTTAFAAENLEWVEMPAYKFEIDDINASILKKTALKYLDMGAELMNAGFPAKGLKLEGYNVLDSVKVVDGIKVGANAFKGCTSLQKVLGKVNVTGTYAFEGCSALIKVDLSSQAIKAGTFKNCAELPAAGITVDGAAFAPTSVGKEAFSGATTIDVDLASCTTIGEAAFAGATAMAGVAQTGRPGVKVLTVAAATIEKNAFNNCNGLKYVHFKNATTLKDDFLANADNLVEIKFSKQIDVTKVIVAGSFGTITGTTLFVVPGQTGVTDNTLTFDDGTNPATAFNFSQIQEEEGVE